MVSAAEGDFADEGFNGPVVLDKAKRKVVEEFGVAGKFAGLAEVVGCADDAFAEKVFPNAIGHDAGGQRIFGVSDPVSEFESAGVFRWNIGGGLGFHRDGDETTRDFGAFIADLTADVNMAIGDGVCFRDRHGNRLEFLEIGGKRFMFFFEIFELGCVFLAITGRRFE